MDGIKNTINCLKGKCAFWHEGNRVAEVQQESVQVVSYQPDRQATGAALGLKIA